MYDLTWGLSNPLISYADDTTLYASISSPRCRIPVAESMNLDLVKISCWCESWGMVLNPKKTLSIIFSRSRTFNPEHPSLWVNNTPIVDVSSIKVLGITLDRKLTFEKHIRSICASIS